MAASGGHWLKIGSGTQAGKRVFVPKNWSDAAATGAMELGLTPGQYNAFTPGEKAKFAAGLPASTILAKKAEAAKVKEYKKMIAEENAGKKTVGDLIGEPASAPAKASAGVDMFGNTIQAKAPAVAKPAKIAAGSPALFGSKPPVTPGKSGTYNIKNQYKKEGSVKDFSINPKSSDGAIFQTWQAASSAAIGASLGQSQAVFIYRPQGYNKMWSVAVGSLPLKLQPKVSFYSVITDKLAGDKFSAILTEYQG